MTEQKIKKLMKELEHYCGNKSDLSVISDCEDYKEIVRNGLESIPFIIENVDNCHVIYFRVLNEITGRSIYEIYETDKMRKDWKKWATEHDYLKV